MSLRTRIAGLILAAAASLTLLAPHAPAQYIPVTGSHVQDASGSPLANGTICFLATDNLDAPLRINTSTGNAIIKPVCSTITNGVISSLQVADPATSFPTNFPYRVTIKDEDSGNVTTYKQVAVTGSSFSWDQYEPSYAGTLQPFVYSVGPAGPAGPSCATGSGVCNMTVPIALPSGPTSALQAATKQYVDSTSASAASSAVAANLIENAMTFSGSDIGAKINAAAAALPSSGGEIYIPASASCYNFSTPIVLPNNSIILRGAGIYGTCLHYTASTGTALTVGSYTTIADLRLSGPGVAGNTGMLFGGVYSAYSHVRSVYIEKFGLGLTFGNNAYLDSFDDVHIRGNVQNILYPTGLSNSGENFTFTGGEITGGGITVAANCVQLGTPGVITNAEFTFIGTSFDTACQVVNNESVFKMYGGHFEDNAAAGSWPFLITEAHELQSVTSDTGSYLYGVSVQLDTTPTGVGLFDVRYRGNLHISGLQMNTNSAIPIVHLGSAAGDQPILNFSDSSIQATEAQIYSIYAGAKPFLTVDTPGVSEHTSAGTRVFASSSPGNLYGQTQAVVQNGSLLGQYVWSGTGTSWLGSILQIAPNNGFQVCNTGYFGFAGYAALGTESHTCGTTLGASSISTGGFTEVPHTPASSSEACNLGQFTDDANFHYVCTAPNTWKRVALSSF